MKSIGFVLLILTLALSQRSREPAYADVPAEVLRAEANRVAVMARAKDSVLAVFSASGGGGGSGVTISPDGYALTNFHVAKPCGNALKCGMADGRLYDAVIVGFDPTGDVAMIRLLGRDDFPHATLGDSDRLQPGDWVFAMGNPFLLATDFQPTVTYGIISGVHRYQYPAGTLLEYTDCLQTDASINPGNSGGPLFDTEGRLVGIVGRCSFEKRGRVSVDVGYAVSINQIKNFLGALRSGRIVDHATLGARAGTDDEGRVIVTDILTQSDAYRRGLRYGDEIVSFGGRAIASPNAFKHVLGIFPKGWRVPLSFRREGRRFDVLVRLSGLHGEEELIEKTAGRPPQVPGPKPKQDPRQPKPGGPKVKPKPKQHEIPGPDPEELPLENLRRQAPMPDIVKKHFEARRGYANYFFNQHERRRVWQAWLDRGGSFAGLAGVWTIAARPAGGNPIHIELDDGGVRLKSATGQWSYAAGDEGHAALAPPGSGGMLLAMHLWRRLALLGPQDYGEVYYLGTLPVAGFAEPLDVLVGLHAGVECRFLFDPAQGLLVGLEMFSSDDADPCEIALGDYHEVDGRWLPQSLAVRCGDELFATLKLESIQFEKGAHGK